MSDKDVRQAFEDYSNQYSLVLHRKAMDATELDMVTALNESIGSNKYTEEDWKMWESPFNRVFPPSDVDELLIAITLLADVFKKEALERLSKWDSNPLHLAEDKPVVIYYEHFADFQFVNVRKHEQRGIKVFFAYRMAVMNLVTEYKMTPIPFNEMSYWGWVHDNGFGDSEETRIKWAQWFWRGGDV